MATEFHPVRNKYKEEKVSIVSIRTGKLRKKY